MNNEERLQKMYGLKYRPDRFAHKEKAFSFANRCVKPQRVVFVDENPDGIEIGWYVVCPADAERLHKATGGLITYAKEDANYTFKINKEEYADRQGRDLKVEATIGKYTTCLPVLSREELKALAIEILKFV